MGWDGVHYLPIQKAAIFLNSISSRAFSAECMSLGSATWGKTAGTVNLKSCKSVKWISSALLRDI